MEDGVTGTLGENRDIKDGCGLRGRIKRAREIGAGWETEGEREVIVMREGEKKER